jgi:hypothetical protein
MQLFEEPVESIFTDGPAVVLKVEQRREPRTRSLYDTRKMEWDEYGVVIYTARGKPAPILKAGEWVMPESAHETRFVRVPDVNGGCAIPPEAGKLLGHYRQNGQRWWVFLEKLGSGATAASPAPAERPQSKPVSQPAKGAPAGRGGSQGQPSARPASPAPPRPPGTSAPGGR